jgi:hypothetical protein
MVTSTLGICDPKTILSTPEYRVKNCWGTVGEVGELLEAKSNVVSEA